MEPIPLAEVQNVEDDLVLYRIQEAIRPPGTEEEAESTAPALVRQSKW